MITLVGDQGLASAVVAFAGKERKVQMDYEVRTRLVSPRYQSAASRRASYSTICQQEFRHFVSVLAPPREVPTYLELVILLFLDVGHAYRVSVAPRCVVCAHGGNRRRNHTLIAAGASSR
jgi:hypothetical protein